MATTASPSGRLVNHTINGSYADLSAVTGAGLYGARALVITEPEDVIQLDPALADEFPLMLAHLRRVGLSPTTNVEWDTRHEVAHRHPRLHHAVFLFGPEAHAVRPDERRLMATAQFNNKNWFLNWCRRMGLPAPATRFYARGEVPTRPRWYQWQVRYVKGAVSASGMQVVKCRTWRRVLLAIEEMDGDYQIQEALRPNAWLNVQYSAEPGRKVRHLATTDQVLAGNVHNGNRFPGPFDPRFVTDRAAEMAAREGIQGVFAFDVPVWSGWRKLLRLLRGKSPVLILECNPRPNGSTYPTIAALKLGAAEWVAVNFHTRHRSLAHINLGDTEYSSERGSGAVIVNWGPILDGKLGVLLIGNPAEQTRLRAELAAILQ